MNVELTKITRGTLHEHIFTPPALPICFDSSGVANGYPLPAPLSFIVGVNAIAWGRSNEIYPYPRLEEIKAEWANVGHSMPEILSHWRNYGIFGTNIDGWFTLDPRNTDHILRAIALFGFVLWATEGEVKVLCGFHRSLGFHSLGPNGGISFAQFDNTDSEIYVVIPTIYSECDDPSTQYIKYDTLETE